jgi:hypothetical protein
MGGGRLDSRPPPERWAEVSSRSMIFRPVGQFRIIIPSCEVGTIRAGWNLDL